MMTIAIRSTYYIFCCRNKEWENPNLLPIWLISLTLYIYIACTLFCYFSLV
jgi:hypothetical protein